MTSASLTAHAYYYSSIDHLRLSNSSLILGKLTNAHSFDLDTSQKRAWTEEIRILKEVAGELPAGSIYFEFFIPRVGKRADVILVAGGIVFVIEFKVGSETFDRAAIEQVHDYALDLKNFHKGSHHLPIVPILVATNARQAPELTWKWAEDQVLSPICVIPSTLSKAISTAIRTWVFSPIDTEAWASSGYQPTPTIIEAALALYRKHDVRAITRSSADAKNLGATCDRIGELIAEAKLSRGKSICFVTGVPGAGKTLAGLNIATQRTSLGSGEHSVFLSGNGPLVDVMREALSRDRAERDSISKKVAMREVALIIQNIHHFRDHYFRDPAAPLERVVIFDEAQRAWDRSHTSKFMSQKREASEFDMSEPEFLLSVMNRHEDWCVVICLIGGGQEINTGEAGLAEWISAVGEKYSDWNIFVSSRLDDRDYIWDQQTAEALTHVKAHREDALHLGVSIRSFRAESLSAFVGHVIDNRPQEAQAAYAKISRLYPVVLTRQLSMARGWLREKARGSERFGLVASSGASRLKPEGVFMKAKIDAPLWFLNARTDVRSSYYLEEIASEFDVQGLELDWTGVCWDADYRYCNGAWNHFAFKGTKWQHVNNVQAKQYLKNAYRVILTRARQGMVIFVPQGDANDGTRVPAFYDETFEYLRRCGLECID